MFNKRELTKRARIKRRIRSKVFWTAEKPRFSVFKSNKFLTAQLIDDANWVTLFALLAKKNADWAKELWKKVAEKWWVKTVVFDRNWYEYHWLIEKIANSAREWWLKF